MLRTALFAAVLSLTSAVTLAPIAAACGGGGDVTVKMAPSPIAAEARVLVDRHFSALSKGKKKTVRRLWSKQAEIVSYAADGSATRDDLDAALARWMKHRKGMTWKIESASERFDGGVDVAVTVTWGGASYADVLTVMPDQHGKLRLTAKSTAPILTEVAAAPSAY